MKLGILVNSDRCPDVIVGLAKSACEQGHEVLIFTMDDGTRLFEQADYAALCEVPGVTMSFCEHSSDSLGVETSGLSDEIVCGSQFDNASMMHNADRVVVL